MRATVEPTHIGRSPSSREHDTGVHPQIGCQRTGRTYGNAYVDRVDGTRCLIGLLVTEETAITAVEPLLAGACAYEQERIALQNIVGIAQKEFHSRGFAFSTHGLSEIFKVVTVVDQNDFYYINTFSFGSCASRHHHAAGCLYYQFVPQGSFVLYHILTICYTDTIAKIVCLAQKRKYFRRLDVASGHNAPWLAFLG